MYISDVHHPSKALQDKLHTLYTLNREKKIDLSFRPPYLDLLNKFGNPHKKLPPIIHVAGTNGKGSTIAFLKSILEAAGYSVHAYTSPHLVHFNERIVLNGMPIDNQYLEKLIDEALELNEQHPVTFFEITTAIAFKAFADTAADICLLETGLGGRLDCTNVITNPIVTIITSVSFDHQEHLGETLPQIASEKAGIMKHQTPCVIAKQIEHPSSNNVQKIFLNKSLEESATLYRYGSDWAIKKQNDTLIYNSFDTRIAKGRIYPLPGLRGAHQIENAGTAIAAIDIIQRNHPEKIKITDDHIAEGLKSVRWPARLQYIGHAKLSENNHIWIDGGHNIDAGRALKTHIKDLIKETPNPHISIILGMMKHKDSAGYIDQFINEVDQITVIPIEGEPASMTSQQIYKSLDTILKKQNIKIKTSQNTDLNNALMESAQTGKTNHIFICGSLYLAGHALKFFK